ncbi:GNAT family N-acetyltransferase [Priestia koreensis]|uniref:GNAT family N-acetyltransferase n=1 Tax=Priestia koreensis TaxID=284581 RepID=UPI00203F1A63|nr:GNAT family N-acetyltransferase [Priestia koreensis]MCM3005204.1 GNAT family N-acetyltransferase [Priestia koreensis]
MIYTHSLEHITADMLTGFFVDWPNPPSTETHLRLLKNSSHVVLGIDETTGQVVGFITAVSDGVLSAYIPLLEVLPAYKKNGIGKELVRKMFDRLSHLYMIDLCCDDDLVPFYKQFGMMNGKSMLLRNYERQSGTPM